MYDGEHSRHSESMEAYVERYVEFRSSQNTVRGGGLCSRVVHTRVTLFLLLSRCSTLTPGTSLESCPLSSRVTITKWAAFINRPSFDFFFFFFTSKYPQNFLLKFMEEGNGITENMWNKSGIYVIFS